MNVILTNDNPCSYELTPANRRLAARQRQETGEESVLFQTDYDFPGLARNLGWSGKVGRERCKHRGTDGTIDCPDCGRKAGAFIAAAAAWLDTQVGRTFRGKGEEYFSF
jgi:hypothetical protein